MKEDEIKALFKNIKRIIENGTFKEGNISFINQFNIYTHCKIDSLKAGAIYCRNLISRYIEDYDSSNNIEIINNVMNVSWIKLHIGKWSDVPIIWRDLYSLSAHLIALDFLLKKDYEEAICILDLSLLMGSDVLRESTYTMIKLAQKLMNIKKRKISPNDQPISKCTISNILNEPILDKHKTLDRIKAPSVFTFKKEYMDKKKPIILVGLIDSWPALSDPNHKWKNLDYIKEVAGMRLVPVEIGARYTDEDWGQSLMKMEDFIDIFIHKSKEPEKREWKGKIGYIAQTELLDQILELKKDIYIPDYTAISETGHLSVQAWFGPQGTVSPCHYDPYHNLLCQVVGRKYIRLYEESYSEYLYPHKTKLSNTSKVDIENPDFDKFPNFKKANYTELILYEGDVLYIPPKMWHYVRSLDVSFSINFWWS